MIKMIVSVKVIYLMSEILDTLMLHETRGLTILLPMLLPVHSSFNPAAYVAGYAFVTSGEIQAPAGSSILADVA